MAADDDTPNGAAGLQGPPLGDPTSGNGAAADVLIERVSVLTARIGELGDPAARAGAEELVSAVIELYGEGLTRIFEAVDASGETGAELRSRLADDGVVASLMLIHDLYPVGLEERVVEALDSVRPYMESHGGNVVLLGIEDGVARIRLEGSCEGCPASASTLELAIKQALDEAAPDLEGLLVEGELESGSPISNGAMELPMVQVAPGRAEAEPSWFDLDGLDGLAESALTGSEIAGIGLIVARVEGSLLAYRDSCPGCEAALAGGELSEGVLSCPSCERRYFLPRAGRSLDEDRLQLEPVPLLAGGAGVRVALAA